MQKPAGKRLSYEDFVDLSKMPGYKGDLTVTPVTITTMQPVAFHESTSTTSTTTTKKLSGFERNLIGCPANSAPLSSQAPKDTPEDLIFRQSCCELGLQIYRNYSPDMTICIAAEHAQACLPTSWNRCFQEEETAIGQKLMGGLTHSWHNVSVDLERADDELPYELQKQSTEHFWSMLNPVRPPCRFKWSRETCNIEGKYTLDIVPGNATWLQLVESITDSQMVMSESSEVGGGWPSVPIPFERDVRLVSRINQTRAYDTRRAQEYRCWLHEGTIVNIVGDWQTMPLGERHELNVCRYNGRAGQLINSKSDQFFPLLLTTWAADRLRPGLLDPRQSDSNGADGLCHGNAAISNRAFLRLHMERTENISHYFNNSRHGVQRPTSRMTPIEVARKQRLMNDGEQPAKIELWQLTESWDDESLPQNITSEELLSALRMKSFLKHRRRLRRSVTRPGQRKSLARDSEAMAHERHDDLMKGRPEYLERIKAFNDDELYVQFDEPEGIVPSRRDLVRRFAASYYDTIRNMGWSPVQRHFRRMSYGTQKDLPEDWNVQVRETVSAEEPKTTAEPNTQTRLAEEFTNLTKEVPESSVASSFATDAAREHTPSTSSNTSTIPAKDESSTKSNLRSNTLTQNRNVALWVGLSVGLSVLAINGFAIWLFLDRRRRNSAKRQQNEVVAGLMGSSEHSDHEPGQNFV